MSGCNSCQCEYLELEFAEPTDLDVAELYNVIAASPLDTSLSMTAVGNISGHCAVAAVEGGVAMVGSDNAQVIKAFGIALTSAISGAQVNIKTKDIITEPTWNWDVNKVIFVGIGGVLTQTPPQTGYSVTAGIALASNKMLVRFENQIDIVED